MHLAAGPPDRPRATAKVITYIESEVNFASFRYISPALDTNRAPVRGEGGSHRKRESEREESRHRESERQCLVERQPCRLFRIRARLSSVSDLDSDRLSDHEGTRRKTVGEINARVFMPPHTAKAPVH